MSVESFVENDRIVLKDRGETVMTMTEIIKNNIVEIQLEGKMRNDVRHFLGDELKLLILLNKTIIIDMKNVTYLSAACSEVLLDMQQAIDENESGSMCLKNIPSVIFKEMRDKGLTELLMIEKTEE